MAASLEARNREIYDLHIRHGWSQYRIAAKYSLDQSRISQIISQVNGQLRIEFLKEIRVLRMNASQQLDEILFQTLEAWHRSYGEFVEHRDGPEGETIITKTLAGCPAFLSLAAQVIDQKMKMWDSEIKSSEQGGGRRRFSGMPRIDALKEAKELIEKRLDSINKALAVEAN